MQPAQAGSRLLLSGPPSPGPDRSGRLGRMTPPLAVALLLLAQVPDGGWGPAQACRAAADDLASAPALERPFLRYLWTPAEDKAALQAAWVAASIAVNHGVSRSQTQVPPASLHGGRLVRVDLRDCLREPADLPALIALWDSLADVDPYLHVAALRLVPVAPYRHVNGRTYRQDWRSVSAPSPASGPAHAQLIALSGCQAPILRTDWFARMTLSTLDGGVYYRFRGLEVGKTTLDGYLRSRGVSQSEVERLRTGERAILLVSSVTAKPRRIDYFQGAGAQPSVAGGRAFVTSDAKNANANLAFHPLYNALDSKTDAHEVIVEQDRRLEYTLFDGRGKLAASVPEDVAADHEIPAPHTRQLQPAIGCIRCHGREDGWRSFGDDFRALGQFDFGGARGLRPFQDSSTGDQLDAALRLRSLFGGNPSDVLRGARDDHAANVFLITGGLRPEISAARVAGVYGALEYSAVTADIAALEVGRPGEPFHGVVGEQTPEDPLIGALRAGKSITRRDWERVYALAAERAQRTRGQLTPAAKPD